MTEEQKQKFRELFPEYTIKDSEVCLSPFIDVFEAGIEIATKELQEKYEDLKERFNKKFRAEWELNDKYQIKKVEAFINKEQEQ